MPRAARAAVDSAQAPRRPCVRPAAGSSPAGLGPRPLVTLLPREGGGLLGGPRNRGGGRQVRRGGARTPGVREPEGSAPARVCARPTPQRGPGLAARLPRGERGAARPADMQRRVLRARRPRGSGFSARGWAATAAPRALRGASRLRAGPRRPGSPARGPGCQRQRRRSLRRLRASRSSAPRPSPARSLCRPPCGDPRPRGPAPRHSRRRVRGQHLNF